MNGIENWIEKWNGIENGIESGMEEKGWTDQIEKKQQFIFYKTLFVWGLLAPKSILSLFTYNMLICVLIFVAIGLKKKTFRTEKFGNIVKLCFDGEVTA